MAMKRSAKASLSSWLTTGAAGWKHTFRALSPLLLPLASATVTHES